MLGTQNNVSKPDAITQSILNVQGMASNSLYNTGVYLSRQQYFENVSTHEFHGLKLWVRQNLQYNLQSP
ncbi:hypothetical protein [Brasilonema sp. UFV-L1]|uniref:hypothetical protein n=1 Tax=Brasilonema sp. UFV-L1 TaxID=2234130 RepID=UPI00145E1C1F|nr:hypothetical protein [Brasilonema sp. UFV-L1]NMG07020.1 hypothetical protein [Brasilonema sp. UFV-L1]